MAVTSLKIEHFQAAPFTVIEQTHGKLLPRVQLHISPLLKVKLQKHGIHDHHPRNTLLQWQRNETDAAGIQVTALRKH